jgi:predicted ATP-grasp superfamily ATP-dependent carboligase
LAIARSLAGQGISFVVLCPHSFSVAAWSRAGKFAVPCPEPCSHPEPYLDLLLSLIEKHAVRVAIPLTDATLTLFERHREQLGQRTVLAMAASTALRRVLDKRANLQLAAQLGIPCPRQFRLEDSRQIPEMIAALGWPIVIKRSRDPIELNVPRFPFKVLYARNERELRLYVDRYCLRGEDPLFQEYARGRVHDLCCFASRGQLLAVHEYLAVRRYNGSAVLRRVIEPTPELVEYSRRMLAALAWDGVAHVSFFLADEEQKTWYMETNGRFWASTEGSVHAGWDFPRWTYDYFRFGRRPEVGPIEIGSETCWHLGDLMAMVKFMLGHGEYPTPGHRPGRVRAVFGFLSGFGPGIHHEVFRWSDPLPALFEPWPRCDRVIRALTASRGSLTRAMRMLFPASAAAKQAENGGDPVLSSSSGREQQQHRVRAAGSGT